jgi:hypothetical protein
LIQNSGKSYRGQEQKQLQKWGKNKERAKSHTKVTNHREYKEDSGLFSYFKSQRIHHKIFNLYQEHWEGRKPKRKWEIRVAER